MNLIFKFLVILGFSFVISCNPRKQENREESYLAKERTNEFALTDTATLHLFDDEERILILSEDQLKEEKEELASYIAEETGEKINPEDLNDSLVTNLVGEAYLENFGDNIAMESLLVGTSEEGGSFSLATLPAKIKGAASTKALSPSLEAAIRTLPGRGAISVAQSKGLKKYKRTGKEGLFRFLDPVMDFLGGEKYIREVMESRSKGLHQKELKQKYFKKAVNEKWYDVKIKKPKPKGSEKVDGTQFVVLDAKKVYPKYDKMATITSSLFEKHGLGSPDLGGDKMFLGMLPREEILDAIRAESGGKLDNIFSMVEDFELKYALEEGFDLKELTKKAQDRLKQAEEEVASLEQMGEAGYNSQVYPPAPSYANSLNSAKEQKSLAKSELESFKKFPTEVSKLQELYDKRIVREELLARIEELGSASNNVSTVRNLKEQVKKLDSELAKYDFESFEDSFQNYFRKNHEERYKVVLGDSISKVLGVNKWTQYSTPDRLMLTRGVLKKAIRDIELSLRNGESAFVHCKSGKGRSATAVVGARAYRIIAHFRENKVPLTKKEIDRIILEQNAQVKVLRPEMGISMTQMYNLRESLYELYAEDLGSAFNGGKFVEAKKEKGALIATATVLSMGALGVGASVAIPLLEPEIDEVVKLILTVRSEVQNLTYELNLEEKEEATLESLKSIVLFETEHDTENLVLFYQEGKELESSKTLGNLRDEQGAEDSLSLQAKVQEK